MLPVPVDLVTTSGSGLDPHISPRPRCSRCPRRKGANIPEDRVRQLVNEHIEGRVLGVFGEPRVNVLELNLALDRLRSSGELTGTQRGRATGSSKDVGAKWRSHQGRRPTLCWRLPGVRIARRAGSNFRRRRARASARPTKCC